MQQTYPNLSTYTPETQGVVLKGDEITLYVGGYHSKSGEGIDIWTTIAQGLGCEIILAMLPGSRIADFGIDNKYTLQPFSVRQSALDLLQVMQGCDSQIHLVGTSMGGLVINYMLANCLQFGNNDIIERIGSLQYVIAPLDIRHIRFPFPQVHSTIASLFSLLLKFHPGIRSQAFAKELLSYNLNSLDSLSGDQTAYESLCYFYRKLHAINPDIKVGYMGGAEDTAIDMQVVESLFPFLNSIFGDKFQEHIFPHAGHGLEEKYAPRAEKMRFQQGIITG